MPSIYSLMVLAIVAFAHLVLSVPVLQLGAQNCYCEEGCFVKEFQTLCCREICEDAASRNLEDECRSLCPAYHTVKAIKTKVRAQVNKRRAMG